MSGATLPIINCFWEGPALGPLHVACIRSFVRVGHRVVLHTYDPPLDLPCGVELADANRLMTRDRVVSYKTNGSLALAANIFRFEIMAAGLGIYVDCDCFCIRRLEANDHIFGWEDDEKINGAVLHLPTNSPLIESMQRIANADFIEPWVSPSVKRRRHLRRLIGLPTPLSERGWGTMGPTGLTYFAKSHALDQFAQPSDVFYPVHWSQWQRLIDPGLKMSDVITARTKILHLWNEKLRDLSGKYPVGSILWDIIERDKITPPLKSTVP